MSNFSIHNSAAAWKSLATWRPYLIIAVVGFLLYAWTLTFQLTYLDDHTLIIDRADVITGWRGIPIIFTTDAFFSGTNFYYRPLLNLSFMLDGAAAGDSYFLYHLDNILLHILAASLVWALLRRLAANRQLAFFLTLIFLVHPVLTQAVAWLPGRNDSLVAIFVLAAMLSLRRFTDNWRIGWALAYAFFYFLAILTKETAVFLPLLALVHFWTNLEGRRRYWAEQGIILALSAAAAFSWFLMRNFAFGSERVRAGAALAGILENWRDALIMAAKMILPANLSVLPVSADSTLWYAVVALPLFAAAIWFSRRRRRARLWFGLAWLLIFFLPPFAIVHGAPFFLEHRLYLPLIGLLVVAGEIDWLKKLDWSQRRVQVAAAIFLVLLASITLGQSRYFKDEHVFWRAAVAQSPHSPLAQKNRGAMLYLSGQPDQALVHYELALANNPEEIMVNNNIGLIYLEQGQYERAEQYLKRELEINPNYDKALFNLGELYSRQGDQLAAAFWWRRALAANPYHQSARERLLNLENKLR